MASTGHAGRDRPSPLGAGPCGRPQGGMGSLLSPSLPADPTPKHKRLNSKASEDNMEISSRLQERGDFLNRTQKALTTKKNTNTFDYPQTKNLWPSEGTTERESHRGGKATLTSQQTKSSPPGSLRTIKKKTDTQLLFFFNGQKTRAVHKIRHRSGRRKMLGLPGPQGSANETTLGGQHSRTDII